MASTSCFRASVTKRFKLRVNDRRQRPKVTENLMNLLMNLSYKASNTWKLQELVRVKGVDAKVLAVRLDDHALKLHSIFER